MTLHQQNFIVVTAYTIEKCSLMMKSMILYLYEYTIHHVSFKLKRIFRDCLGHSDHLELFHVFNIMWQLSSQDLQQLTYM